MTLIERRECAEQLIAAMYPRDEAGRKAALAGLEKVFSSILKDENNAFSDVYCVFQEERHSALTPDERTLLNPLYLKQEMAAVIRLLSHAQTFMAREDYVQALPFIEATQMAELRLRAAQDMKIKCLRALGRQAEADQLARENLLAWPAMNGTRRVFRFLGMVANEGRRLLAGLTARITRGT
jgi:alkyl sulfatase BDS1-like metallo-beta-lactamase superfamily hydrolase